MDSNHRYSAPKADAIAARRHPEIRVALLPNLEKVSSHYQSGSFVLLSLVMDTKAFDMLSSIYPEDISFLKEDEPFRFLASVLLSAQTRDDYVNAVTPVLWSRFPDVHELACADIHEIEEIIHSLGFFHTKARNLKALASEIDARGGAIPSSIEELVRLPGVGRKTANCYINHINAAPAVIVDTHFMRVAKRLGYAHGNSPEEVEMEIRDGFDSSIWSRMSMVLNLHGRKYCHARKPDCAGCPVHDYCKSRQDESGLK